MRIAIGLVVAGASTGCSSGSDHSVHLPRAVPASAQEPLALPPLPPQEPAPTMHGSFRGTATRGSEVVHAELLVTADGAFRLYLGAADPRVEFDESGWLQAFGLDAADPMQANGHVVLEGERAAGFGTIVGEHCSLAAARPACTAPADVELDLRLVRGETAGVTGELRVGSPSTATWQISANAWDYYRSESVARQGGLAGIVVEELSELGRAESMRIVIDRADRIFFQSTATGCIGNGTLAPHAEGQYVVHDVSVLVESCAKGFEHLNGTYGGLATWIREWWEDWSSEDYLLMYLSTVDAATPRALTLYGWYD